MKSNRPPSTDRRWQKPEPWTLFAAALFAVSPLAAEPLPDDLLFEHLTNRDGLSQMRVCAVEQDRQGFLWLGTGGGLDRYDGQRLRSFQRRPGDPASPSFDSVQTLHEDGGGRLWIGTAGDGLHRYDPVHGRFTAFRHDPGDSTSLAHDDVLCLHEGRGGRLWIGTGAGLDSIEPAADAGFDHHRHDPGAVKPERIQALLEDGEGRLWIGTDGGLVAFDPVAGGSGRYRGQREGTRPGALDLVRSLHEDGEGRIWVGTRGGLARPDREARTLEGVPGGPAAEVRSILGAPEGRLWLATSSGLVRLDPATGERVTYRHDPRDPHSLGHDSLCALYADRTGTVWIGAQGGGVDRFDPARPRFTTYRHDPDDPESLAMNDVGAVLEDRRGRLWVGLLGGGLQRSDSGTSDSGTSDSGASDSGASDRGASDRGAGRFTHYRHDPGDPTSLGQDKVLALLEDREGRLWIGTDLGLDLLDPETESFVHYRAEPYAPRTVWALHEDRAGRVWMGTEKGLDRFDAGRFVHHRHDPDEPMSLSHDDVVTIAEDSSGQLLVGTWGGGLNVFDPDRGSAVRHRHDPEDPLSLAHDHVSTLHVDSGGVVWIGTRGAGLDRWDPRTRSFRHHTEADGLADNTVYAIEEDGLGRLWIATSRGLSRYDPAARRWASFDVGDGLQDDEFNLGVSHRGAGGRMYFGGVRGLTVFRPELFSERAEPPPVVLTSFEAAGGPAELARAVDVLQAVELSHRESFFTFEFAALCYTRPDRNLYAYRLEGLDTGWVHAGSRPSARYTSVPPGEYVFRFRGANADGVWNEGRPLRIVVTPPPWKTWWAYALYGLAVLLGTLGYGRAQRRKIARERAVSAELERRVAERTARIETLVEDLETRNADLESFTYTVTHDLKSPLVTAKGFLGFLEQDAAAGNAERVAEDVKHVRGAVEKMHRLIDDLLAMTQVGRGAVTVEEVPFGEIVDEALEALAGTIAESRPELVVSPDLPRVFGDRTQLMQVAQNLIGNALKYMGGQKTPRVEVGSRQEDGETVLYVRDNGMGIEPRHHESVFGLFQRLDAHDEGSGIGLALVKRIVEYQGGRVWVESEGPGTGSTFCFTLAARPTDEARGEL